MSDLAQLSLAELAAHLAEVTAELQRRAMSPAEKKRQQTAERTRRWRERQAEKGADRDAGCDAAGDAPVTHSTERIASRGDVLVTLNGGGRDAAGDANPQVSPSPPSSPAPPHPHAYTRGQPPTVEQVVGAMSSMIVPFPSPEWPEIAQAYLDARERCMPPWHTKPTHVCPEPQPINLLRWQADFRGFLRSWKGVEVERAARQRQQTANGTALHAARPRAPDPIPPGFSRWFQAQYPTARISISDAFDNPAYRKEYLAENSEHVGRA